MRYIIKDGKRVRRIIARDADDAARKVNAALILWKPGWALLLDSRDGRTMHMTWPVDVAQ